MGYTPSLSDIGNTQANGGYTPSLSDISPTQNYTIEFDNSQNLPANPEQSSLDATMHGLGQMGRAALGGYMNFGQGLLNTPGNVLNFLGKQGYISPQTLSSLSSHFPVYPQNWNQQLGVEPGVVNSLISNLTQYAPYGVGASVAAGPEAALVARSAAQGMGGMAYGATQSQNPVQGATQGGLAGAGTELGLSGLSALASPVWNASKNFLSQFPATGLFNNIKDTLSADRDQSNQQAFNVAQQNFENSKADTNNKWQVAKGYAAAADNTPGINIDNSSYLDNLQNQSAQIQQKLKHNPDSTENNNALTLVNNFMNAPHDTLTGMIEHNQALNNAYQDTVTPGTSAPFSTIKSSIGALKNTIQQNFDNNGLGDTVGPAWNDANQSTKDHNQTFNEVIGPTGKAKPSSFSQFMTSNNPGADPSSFVNDYLPGKGEGTQKMEQFSQMLGDDDFAKSVLRKNYFGQVDNPNKFIKQYNNLSPDQQGYLFNGDQNDQIQAFNKILSDNPSVLKNTLFKGFFNHALPGLIGGSVVAAHSGGNALHEMLPEMAELALGGLAGQSFKPLANALSSNKGIQKYYVNSLLNPGQKDFGNALGNVGNSLTQSIVTPSIVNSGGTQ